MSTPTLTPDERRHLRTRIIDVLRTDADDERDLARFLPLPEHHRALRTDTLIVIGERGTGKTALFQFLTNLESKGLSWADVQLEKSLDPLPPQSWVDGHGVSRDHPDSSNTLAKDHGEDVVRSWWIGRLVQRLSGWDKQHLLPKLPAEGRALADLLPDDVESTWKLARQAHVPLLAWLNAVDDRLQQQSMHITVTYDYLDRLGATSGIEQSVRYASPLLALWTDLGSRLRHLHGKVFLREDIFDVVKRHRTDGSKLQLRAEVLEWGPADLYRMLLKHIGLDRDLRSWLGRSPGGLKFTPHKHLGHVPPLALPQETMFPHRTQSTDGATQRDLAHRLAGETMGTGPKKGYTHRWIINHLQDGRRRVFPRSVLTLVREAALGANRRAAPEPPGLQLLHPTDLEQAKAPTGVARLRELQSEHIVVLRLNSLRGEQTPFSRDQLIELLSRPSIGEDPKAWAADGLEDNGAAALSRLIDLGTLYRRLERDKHAPQRFDVPELLRVALDIRRKGGARRT